MKKYLNGPSILVGLVCFAVFMVAASAFYYLTAGVFVSAELATLYAVLAALGALAVVFHRFLFSIFFYIGCLLGWLSGQYVGGLEGSFAPTAGIITAFFLIAVFALIGTYLEYRHIRRGIQRARARRERKQQEEREAREKAAAAAGQPASPFGASAQEDPAAGPSGDTCPPQEHPQAADPEASVTTATSDQKSGPQL